MSDGLHADALPTEEVWLVAVVEDEAKKGQLALNLTIGV